MSENVKTNSLRAWLLAARPKTLTAAAVPVMIGVASTMVEMQQITGVKALPSGSWLPALLCFLFAFVMQIDANFVNDYYDCVRGRDDDSRLGPQRACQQGWVTLPAMRKAIAITSIVACMAGMPLIFYGGWQLIGIGVLCLAFCFLYTTLLAGKGMGDVLVLLFFGLIPCYFTYYVTMPEAQQCLDNMRVWLLALATGLVVDTLLIVNNYRDIDNDRSAGKVTLVVLIGKKTTELLYLLTVPVALVLVTPRGGVTMAGMAVMLLMLLLHLSTWRTMVRTGSGRALNRVLGMTARNIFIYGILTTLLVIMS